MTHAEIWNNAKPIEPETCRYVGSYLLRPTDGPDYLFTVYNEETGYYDLYVKPPQPELPYSRFIVLLAPYQVCRVRHEGTIDLPVAHIRQLLKDPDLAPLFLEAHPTTFTHVTTNGIRPLNTFELRGYQFAVDPSSTILPEEFWLLHAIQHTQNLGVLI